MLLALILTDVAFGVVSRVVPQLNVFAVGFPAKIDRRPRCSSAPRCRSSPAGSATSCRARSPPALQHAEGRLAHGRRQDREGNTQEARRGAQEGPGRAARMDLNGAVVLIAGAARAVGLRPEDGASSMQEAMRRRARPDRDARASSTAKGVGDAVHDGRPARRARPLAPIVARLRRSPASPPTSARSASSRRRRRSSPTSRSSTRSPALKNIFGPNAAGRAGQERRSRSAPSARSSRSPCSRSSTSWPRWSARPPQALLPQLARAWSCAIAQRAARSPTS